MLGDPQLFSDVRLRDVLRSAQFGNTRAVGTALEQLYAEYSFQNMIVTGITDANGNTAKFEYDDYGRKTKWCFPVQTKSAETYNCSDFEEYAYDANGNRTSLRKRDTRIITYQYDDLNRMTYKNLPGTSTNDVYYGYELTGAQTFARFGSTGGQGISTNYTGFGEPEADTVNLGGVTRTITRQFNANGNRTRITHPGGQFFQYEYDGLDRLETLLENGGPFLISDAYDAYERPESRATVGTAMTVLHYDAFSRLNGIDYRFNGLADDLDTEFGYNPAGQLIQHTLSNAVYDHTGSVGITGAYTVNDQNQYQNVNGVTYSYDANGNLTSDGQKTYTYDVENRLISVSGTSPTLSATLSYDPMGRLYRYTANGQTTDFVYDGDSLILEYLGGAISKRYIHGTAVDTPLVQYTGSGVDTNRQFLHKNHQGSVIAISDNSGNVIAKNTYDAYGVPAATNQGRFGYTGQMYLAELKLYHYRARGYKPDIGGFLQLDPVGYADQVNLYAYVGNDPMNFTDPSGMQSACAGSTADACYDVSVLNDSPRSSNEGSGVVQGAVGKGLGNNREIPDVIKPAGTLFNDALSAGLDGVRALELSPYTSGENEASIQVRKTNPLMDFLLGREGAKFFRTEPEPGFKNMALFTASAFNETVLFIHDHHNSVGPTNQDFETSAQRNIPGFVFHIPSRTVTYFEGSPKRRSEVIIRGTR